MGVLDDIDSLSDCAERLGPDPENDISVSLLRWDNMADPLTSDLCSKVAGWEDYDDVPLWTPKLGVDWYYVDDESNIFDIDEMIEEKPDWFDAPDELPPWYTDSQSE
jgi:hypothetical protein